MAQNGNDNGKWQLATVDWRSHFFLTLMPINEWWRRATSTRFSYCIFLSKSTDKESSSVFVERRDTVSKNRNTPKVHVECNDDDDDGLISR